MKNTLTDLQNHLFAQLERLGDEDIRGEQLQEEFERAKAVTSVASQIIANGNLALKAEAFRHEYLPSSGGDKVKKFPPMLKASFLKE